MTAAGIWFFASLYAMGLGFHDGRIFAALVAGFLIGGAILEGVR